MWQDREEAPAAGEQLAQPRQQQQLLKQRLSADEMWERLSMGSGSTNNGAPNSDARVSQQATSGGVGHIMAQLRAVDALGVAENAKVEAEDLAQLHADSTAAIRSDGPDSGLHSGSGREGGIRRKERNYKGGHSSKRRHAEGGSPRRN